MGGATSADIAQTGILRRFSAARPTGSFGAGGAGYCSRGDGRGRSCGGRPGVGHRRSSPALADSRLGVRRRRRRAGTAAGEKMLGYFGQRCLRRQLLPDRCPRATERVHSLESPSAGVDRTCLEWPTKWWAMSARSERSGAPDRLSATGRRRSVAECARGVGLRDKPRSYATGLCPDRL